MAHQSFTQISTNISTTLEAVLARFQRHLATATGHALVKVDDKTTLHTRLQVVFGDRPVDPAERALHQNFVVHAIAAEKMGPGGFDACLARTIALLRGNTAKHTKTLVGRPTHQQDLRTILSGSCSCSPSFLASALEDALLLAGLGGRIVVEKAQNTTPNIELVAGHTFTLMPAMQFAGSVLEPKIVLIDGFIESVAEIDCLLQDAHATMDHVLLFSRGMAHDVVNTLRVNHERGTLRVVPVHVPMDIDSLNTFADLSVVSGADVVSAHKGDLISTLRLVACPRVEHASLHHGRLMLVATATRRAVQLHIEELRRRRLVLEQEELGKLIDSRIRSLSPGHVVLRLPDDGNFVQSAQAVDHALRGIAAAVSHGMVDHHGLAMLADPAPASSVAGAIMHSDLCAAEIARVGAVITS